MAEVSVIVPIYKSERTLKRCIESILEQTYKDFELLLIDDGSPDNCGNICEEYARIDSRVKVVHQCNAGVSSARNAGLDIACGKYILFVDSDDYVNKDYISQMCVHKSDLTACGLVVRDECGRLLYSIKHNFMSYSDRSSINYAKLYAENVLYSPYCKLFVNRIIQGNKIRFPIDVNWGEDGMFVADYLQHVDNLTVLDYIGYNYIKYESENSLSSKVRVDVVEMIALSRSYCIEKMRVTSPGCIDEVNAVCTEDAKRNIAYFVRKLFENTALNKKEKIEILQHYMKNRFVNDIFSNADIYFAGKPAFQIALSQNNAASIISSYCYEQKRQLILARIYQIYDKQPEAIKNIYRYIKNKVSK